MPSGIAQASTRDPERSRCGIAAAGAAPARRPARSERLMRPCWSVVLASRGARRSRRPRRGDRVPTPRRRCQARRRPVGARPARGHTARRRAPPRPRPRPAPRSSPPTCTHPARAGVSRAGDPPAAHAPAGPRRPTQASGTSLRPSHLAVANPPACAHEAGADAELRVAVVHPICPPRPYARVRSVADRRPSARLGGARCTEPADRHPIRSCDPPPAATAAIAARSPGRSTLPTMPAAPSRRARDNASPEDPMCPAVADQRRMTAGSRRDPRKRAMTSRDHLSRVGPAPSKEGRATRCTLPRKARSAARLALRSLRLLNVR